MAKLDRHLDVIQSALEEKLISRTESGYISSDLSNLRSFEADDKVLFRVPGLHGEMTYSWDGHFVVMRRVGQLDYEIGVCGNPKKKKRIVHINNLNPWREEEASVYHIVVATEDDDSVACKPKLVPRVLSPEQQNRVLVVLDEF